METFANVARSGNLRNSEKFTTPNCLSFGNPHGTTRAQIWKIVEDLGFNSSQVVGLVKKKKANYMDITCKNREIVLKLHKNLMECRNISNLRLYEYDKVFVALHWVPVPFPIDALSAYLEQYHGNIVRHVNKIDQKGFQMGLHLFKMRKDQLTSNPTGSYIHVLGCEFSVKYAKQRETCHLCGKAGHKSLESEEKEERKKWPNLQKNTQNKNKNRSSNENSGLLSASGDLQSEQTTPSHVHKQQVETQSKEMVDLTKDWFE